MATSNTGGAFGFLRKSIGGVVYSVSTASIKGIKKQVARQKPTSVRNPKTISQIVQRMKVVPAQLFYQAFEKAAGSVENNPLSHSFQGIAYGNKNKLRFMQLAMNGDPKAYVPKGINFAVPGVYQVSEGSLPNLPSGNSSTGAARLIVGTAVRADDLEALQQMGIEVGDQVTCIALLETRGVYRAGIARVIVAAGNNWDVQNNDNDMNDIKLLESGINTEETASGNVACVAFILSRGTSSSTAKRSTAFMTLTPDYASLMSPEAYDAAVDSYITGVAYNSLNSEWYLNQGSSQAFNGQVYSQQLTLAAGDGVEEFTGTFLLGRQVAGSGMRNVIFTSDGTSAGTAYALINGEWTTAAPYTAARVAAAMGNVSPDYRQYSAAIAAQMSGNA
jgi:hypothetical protein